MGGNDQNFLLPEQMPRFKKIRGGGGIHEGKNLCWTKPCTKAAVLQSFLLACLLLLAMNDRKGWKIIFMTLPCLLASPECIIKPGNPPSGYKQDNVLLPCGLTWPLRSSSKGGLCMSVISEKWYIKIVFEQAFNLSCWYGCFCVGVYVLQLYFIAFCF